MAETLENYSFFDKGIFHILQDALQVPLVLYPSVAKKSVVDRLKV